MKKLLVYSFKFTICRTVAVLVFFCALLLTIKCYLPTAFAQSATSNTVKTLVGNASPRPQSSPSPTPAGTTDPAITNVFANDFAFKILGSDGCINFYGNQQVRGLVSASNVRGCVESIKPLHPVTENEMLTSSINYVYFQCVGFVKAAIGGETGQRLNDWGVPNAFNYAQRPPAGYRFIYKETEGDTMKIGDIAVWGANNYSSAGHVAIVVGVDGNRAFTVAEANFGTPGSVRNTRVVAINDPVLLGFARKI